MLSYKNHLLAAVCAIAALSAGPAAAVDGYELLGDTMYGESESMFAASGINNSAHRNFVAIGSGMMVSTCTDDVFLHYFNTGVLKAAEPNRVVSMRVFVDGMSHSIGVATSPSGKSVTGPELSKLSLDMMSVTGTSVFAISIASESGQISQSAEFTAGDKAAFLLVSENCNIVNQ